MGEFGRTPRINQNAGRDHWPRSWSVVVGGGGMKDGQVVGATDKDGVDIVDRPVGVMDLVATMTKTMGINLEHPVHHAARPADQDRRRRQADQGAVRLSGLRSGLLRFLRPVGPRPQQVSPPPAWIVARLAQSGDAGEPTRPAADAATGRVGPAPRIGTGRSAGDRARTETGRRRIGESGSQCLPAGRSRPTGPARSGWSAGVAVGHPDRDSEWRPSRVPARPVAATGLGTGRLDN